MTFRLVDVPGPITLVPSDKLYGQLARLARDRPHLRFLEDPRQLLAELMARRDGVAVTFGEPRGGRDWSLLLYLSTCVLRLYLTKRFGDAYVLGAVDPMRISDHARLAQRCLWLRPAGWRMAPDVRTIPRPSDSYWNLLFAEWERLGHELAVRRGAPTLTAAQSAYLDTLDRTIDATERIVTEVANATRPYPYRDVTTTAERRQGTRSVYVFRIAGRTRPESGTFVQVRGEPGLRGQVTRVAGDSVTVRFDQPVDWARFAEARQGELEETPSRVVYEKQRETVALLRSRQAHNTTLLTALVDHAVRGLQPVRAEPTEPLDPDQIEAFRRGLGTRDLLTVLGPPGTGKTRVITQLARAAAVESGERVLVTSHTNRAVDNVLARLRGLEVIRVGHEGSVTAEGQPYLLERRAAELRERVLGDVGRFKAGYERLATVKGWANDLNVRVGALNAARDEETQACARHDEARRAVGGAAQTRVDELTAEREARDRAVDRHRRRSERRARRLAWTRARAQWPLLGLLLGALSTLWERRQATAEQRADRLRAAALQVADALAAAEQELDVLTRDHPSVRAAREAAESATHARAAAVPPALKAAREARAAVAAVAAPPPVREDGDREAVERAVEELLRWLQGILPRLGARAELLDDWHAAISGATDELYPELIRYADVIAATSIGTASRPELSGLHFDLAIVDEAGQIGIPDALVPLARARRGVLVGDDQQLPPFLDSEVEKWGDSAGDPLVRDILTKSALERLIDGLPGDHVVRLTRQRRMPAEIADFVSAAFYGGRLRTAVRREHHDAVFARPFAFVDTARLPLRERSERPGRGRERWGLPGYVNEAEARLLVELAVHYHRGGADWAVIVPYRAQVAAIVSALTPRIGDAELVGLNVGTVDSFQGGEREVILYGFTRSNPDGKVGFLKELRRANVAFTRAQDQLVLVGDMSTLTAARDRPFRDLAESLRDHLARVGDIRQYPEVHARVRKLNEGGGEA